MAINESAQTPQEVAAQCEAFKKTYQALVDEVGKVNLHRDAAGRGEGEGARPRQAQEAPALPVRHDKPRLLDGLGLPLWVDGQTQAARLCLGVVGDEVIADELVLGQGESEPPPALDAQGVQGALPEVAIKVGAAVDLPLPAAALQRGAAG